MGSDEHELSAIRAAAVNKAARFSGNLSTILRGRSVVSNVRKEARNVVTSIKWLMIVGAVA